MREGLLVGSGDHEGNPLIQLTEAGQTVARAAHLLLVAAARKGVEKVHPDEGSNWEG